MGLFSKLFNKSSDKSNNSNKKKSYEKYGDILKKTLTTKEQRQEAFEYLAKLEAQDAVPQILKRFEMVVESGLIDTREKEQCMNTIVAYGEKAKEFVIDVIKVQRRISWPIKIAEKLLPQDEYVTILLDCLNPDMPVFDEDILERNQEMILALKDVKDERIVGKVAQFLSLRDENVRMAAIDCLEEQAKHFESAKKIILDLAASTETNDDNSRFQGVISEIIQKNQWGESKQ